MDRSALLHELRASRTVIGVASGRAKSDCCSISAARAAAHEDGPWKLGLAAWPQTA
jgi:hypothetical protein